MSYKSRGRLGDSSFNFLHPGSYVQLNPIKSDPQLTGTFVNKTEVFNKEDFPVRHDSTIDSWSNPNLSMSSSTDLYENVQFDKAHEKSNARQNRQINNYSQVVADLQTILKKRLPKPPPKPKEIWKKHADVFSVSRKKSAVEPDADITDGMRKTEICSTYQKLNSPDSDYMEMYVRKRQSSFTSNTNENRDSDIYSRNSKISDINENHDEKCDVSEVYENIKYNQTNVPDDVKVKIFDTRGLGPDLVMDFIKTKRRKSASDVLNNENKVNTSTYATMHPIKRIDQWSNRKLCNYKPNTESCHIKGDEGCIYSRMDSMYIYSINPNCVTGNAPPFLRTKEKTDPLPCFCPKNAWGTQRVTEKEVFFSCEDIYVNVCSMLECTGGTKDTTVDNTGDPIFRDIVDSTRVDDDSVSYVIEKFRNDDKDSDTDSISSGTLFRKKLQQLKRFLTDWT